MSTFIWYRGLKGPTAAIIPKDFLFDGGGTRLQTVKISGDDEKLSLDELIKKYPAPQQPINSEFTRLTPKQIKAGIAALKATRDNTNEEIVNAVYFAVAEQQV